MPSFKCSWADCTYVTEETDATVAIQLLSLHNSTHSPVATQSTAPHTATAEKVKRPTINPAGTCEEWDYFKQRWEDYKQATRLTGKDVIFQLLECCEESLRKDLTRTHDKLSDQPEATVLDFIKRLAVRPENLLVARVQLQYMRQERDEPIRSFCARLRGQARVCNFTAQKQCTCSSLVEFDYSDVMVRDALIRGLEDEDTRLEIMGQPKQDLTLDQVLQLAEARESGRRTASKLINETSPPITSAATSSYRRNNRVKENVPKQQPPVNSQDSPCRYCGKFGHGYNSNSQVRMRKCSAYNHTCAKCGIPRHHERVCQNKNREKPLANNKITSQEYDHSFDGYIEMCSTKTTLSPTTNAITLDHYVYNELNKTWQCRLSDPQPYTDVTVQYIPADAEDLGIKPSLKQSSPAILHPGMADTGCQSCLSGTNLLQKLGIHSSNLVPVRMKMKAANNQSINILGALPLRITGQSPAGSEVSTRQLVYFTNDNSPLFLSKQACTALGIISLSFPTIGESTTASRNAAAESSITRDCQCPRREIPPPPPKTLPYPPTLENCDKLEKWLLDYYKTSTFNVCEHQTLPMMSGPPLRLMIDPTAKPFACHKPIPIPVHWQNDVYAGLDQDCRLGVIEPVPVGTPVTWCHKMVVVPKKSGKPRRTVNLQALNDHATRETHHTESPFHLARSVPHKTLKSTFDAWNGYHSILLHEDDRHYTTFITPKGRYRYRVAPQGYIASGDGYTRRFDEIVADFPCKIKCIDDTLLWANSVEEAFYQAVKWLDLCGRNGIILNPSKFTFSRPTVEFAGFEITPTTVRPCPRLLEAIRNFPTPKNITDIRSWFGLVNQVSYAFASAKQMLPLRNQLKPGNQFTWTPELEKIFQESKATILNEIKKGVEIFDKSLPTTLATDWSKDGIGFWLLQKHCKCQNSKFLCCKTGWRIVLVGSRFTSGAESRYAPIEGEALAVVEALKKAKHFVLGCSDLTIAVDHKPLLKVFGDRSLEDIDNPRLIRLKEKTLHYRFKMVHIPGVKNTTADSMSRNPVGDPIQLNLSDDSFSATEMAATFHNLITNIRAHEDPEISTCVETNNSAEVIQSVTWDAVRLATTSDPTMLELSNTIEDGFPSSRSDLNPEIRKFYQYRDNLSTYDGVILYKDRLVIPPALRKTVLTSLHAAHQGVTQMCARAESSIFWPGMTPEIIEQRARCVACNKNAPSNPNAPPTPPTLPVYPFQAIASDYFQYMGKSYLVVVDRYSNWPVVELANNGAEGLISALKRVFITYGISEELSSDGGTEYTAQITQKFLKDWGVNHRKSSVAFPHSNCRAELAVKTVKRMIMNNTGPNGTVNSDQFQRAMLQYRNAPDRDTGLSPAMCIFGHPIRDFIPIHRGKYLPHPAWRETLVAREEALRNRHQKTVERLSEHTRSLPPLKVGDSVRIQNQVGPSPTKWDKTGIIVEVRQYDQYVIRIDGSGRVTLRNRKFLRQYTPVVQRAPVIQLPGKVSAPQPWQVNSPPLQNHDPTTEYKTIQIPPQPVINKDPLDDTPDPIKDANPPPAVLPTAEKDNPQPLDPVITPASPKPKNKPVPLALRQLQPHNKPGKKEQTIAPSPNRIQTRTFRRSNNNSVFASQKLGGTYRNMKYHSSIDLLKPHTAFTIQAKFA